MEREESEELDQEDGKERNGVVNVKWGFWSQMNDGRSSLLWQHQTVTN